MSKNQIKPLEQTFIGKGEVKGLVFTQIAKSSQAYLYEVKSNDSQYYEVFLRKIDTRFNSEYYPKAKSFGKIAWTLIDLESATIKFKQIS
jgi:hypothetical protein